MPPEMQIPGRSLIHKKMQREMKGRAHLARAGQPARAGRAGAGRPGLVEKCGGPPTPITARWLICTGEELCRESDFVEIMNPKKFIVK